MAMSLIWWDVIEGGLFGLILVASMQLRIWGRVETVASRLSSDKVRTALRAAFYAAAGALLLIPFSLEDISKQNPPGTPLPVMFGLLVAGAFVFATLKTAGEKSSPDEPRRDEPQQDGQVGSTNGEM